MKKIGIITLHRVVNYGSVLQTYALQEKINSLEGYKSEVIDYYPERLTKLGMLKRIKSKSGLLKKSVIARTLVRAIILPSYIIRFKTFFNFLNNYVYMSSITYKSETAISEAKKYDIYCTGSDQVWNSGWNEKIDTPYYLKFVPDNKKKISYAASFGKKKLADWEIEETKQLLKRYSYISVREASGLTILEDMGINGTCVVDPTLLLNGDEWRKLSSNKYYNEKYILVYNLNRNKKIDKYAANLSKKTNITIKYLSYQIHEFYKRGKMYCNPKVEDFLALIDNAQYVITDSFHATAFSLNFNTQFIIVYPGKYSTRLQSVLELTGLTNRVAKDENDISITNLDIDYEKVNAIIDRERQKSFEWLKKALC